jgi:hypothetical protein
MSLLMCPTCGLPFESVDTPAMPFCSARCRLIDLGRWLNEEPCLPVEPGDNDLDDLELGDHQLGDRGRDEHDG